MSDTKKNPGIVDKIWNLFSSITLAVVIFTVISITSIVGTIIEQQAEPEKNIKIIAKFVGESGAVPVYRIIDALGFTDMFHAWWFFALLFIFASNLIICSIDRLPKILKAVKEPVSPLSPQAFNAMSVKREAILEGSLDAASAAAGSALDKIGFKAAKQSGSGETQFFAEKGRYSRLGVYVTHLSILIIMTGAIVGLQLGFNGHLNLLEGTSSSAAYHFNGKEIPLGFDIHCDDFEVSFYDNSDTPKSYKSWLRIIENGKEIVKKEIEVNIPLKYKGITFYQSSYGFAPSKDSVFRFSVSSSNGVKQDFDLMFEESFTIPGTNIKGKVVDFSPAIAVDESGKLFSYAESMNNPAVFVEFTENGKAKYKQWILKRYPQTWKVADGIVEFKDLWKSQYTGLQVRKDPGVWIVYLGCLVMAIGLYAAFFMSHRRIWVRLVEDKNGVVVSVAASANKNKIAMEQQAERLLKLIGESLKKK